MKTKHSWIYLFISLLLGYCASVGTPTGGPKDIKPPVLISSSPANKQIQFNGTTVELTFDEDIQLNSPKEEIIISPSPGKNIDIQAKGNKVTLKPELPWEKGLTYTLQFREGIQDITEKNSPLNLTLAFSTGDYIDSLHISGSIKDLLKSTPLTKYTIAITSADTFNIFKHTPVYFTKSNKRGQFILENLHNGTYFIYAFNDVNKNLKVDSKTESYAFQASPLLLTKHIDSVSLGAIRLDSRVLKLLSARNNGNYTLVRLSKYITDYTLESKVNINHSFGENQTELMVYGNFPTADSTQVHITARDSIDSRLDTTFYIKSNTNKSSKGSFKWALGKPTIDTDLGKLITEIQTNKPVSEINADSLYIKLDSVNFITFKKQDFTFDLPHKKINIEKLLDKTIFKTLPDKPLILKAGKGLFISIEQDTTRTNEAPIVLLTPERTGLLSIQTKTQSPNFIIQLIKADGTLIQSATNKTQYTFKNIIPGDYQLRMIDDRNANGKWDSGNYYRHEEPEKITYYKTSDRKSKIPIRANWEVGPLVLIF